jgi:hypothetical protein
VFGGESNGDPDGESEAVLRELLAYAGAGLRRLEGSLENSLEDRPEEGGAK